MANSKSTQELASDAPPPEAGGTAPEDALQGVVVGLPDGTVTFTRPGIEAREFTVDNGTIRTNAEGYDWLLRNVTGATPVTD